jgi:tetratricopeptide (TPR) repeat protein
MDLNNQIELELYFADHFDTVLFPVLADIYLQKNDLKRARKVCEIGLKHHKNDSAGLFLLAQINNIEGNYKEAEKLLESVLMYSEGHLAAAEMLCEIQTVLGRASGRLLKSWKIVLSLSPQHNTAKSFIAKVQDPEIEKQPSVNKKTPKKNPLVDEPPPKEKSIIRKIEDEISEPLKVSSRLATFTLVSVLKNQGLFDQALNVLDALEEKGENLNSISLERETIQTLIKNSQKD